MTKLSLDMDTPPEELTPGGASDLVQALRTEIERHDLLYHRVGTPEISDAAYDLLFHRLRSLERAYPSLASTDSPTQRVGAAPRTDLPTVRHTAPMLSLDSTQDAQEVRRFDERIRKAVEGDLVEYVLQPKLDGVSIELVYERGVLARAVTRGDGRQGEGVTENARTISSVRSIAAVTISGLSRSARSAAIMPKSVALPGSAKTCEALPWDEVVPKRSPWMPSARRTLTIGHSRPITSPLVGAPATLSML